MIAFLYHFELYVSYVLRGHEDHCDHNTCLRELNYHKHKLVLKNTNLLCFILPLLWRLWCMFCNTQLHLEHTYINNVNVV